MFKITFFRYAFRVEMEKEGHDDSDMHAAAATTTIKSTVEITKNQPRKMVTWQLVCEELRGTVAIAVISDLVVYLRGCYTRNGTRSYVVASAVDWQCVHHLLHPSAAIPSQSILYQLIQYGRSAGSTHRID